MSKDILKAFSIEALRFKEKPRKNENIDFHIDLINTILNIKCNYTEREGVGLGNVVDFNTDDNKWRGITLVHNGILVQFYLVSKRGGYQAQNQTHLNVQFQTNLDQRYI